MKLLHIAECAGGVERYLAMLLPLLKNEGIEQCFICSEDYNLEKYRTMEVTTIQMNLRQTFSPMSIFRQVLQLRKMIQKIHPDVVYCHSSFAGGLGRLAVRKIKDVKVVYNPHGWAFNMGFVLSTKENVKPSQKQIVYLTIERFLAKWTDKIVCISKAERVSALVNSICKEQKLCVIENGIEVQKVRESVAKDRVSMGFSQNDFVVGMIGRLSKQKAPDVFIRAAKRIQERIPEAVFMIVGDGEEKECVMAYAQKQGLKLYVTGWTDEPYAYLKTFDIAMLMSRWEGFGLAIVEYMAAEKNFVASRVDAIPTLVDDGVDGLLVPMDDDVLAAEKVVWLYEHPEEAAHMREVALKKVMEKYDVKRVASETATMLREL